MIINQRLTYLLICTFFVIQISAQEKKRDLGKLSGGLESLAQYYNKKDEKLGFFAPENRFRSNNYFKLDYTNKGFIAGFQYEVYAPDVVLGYPENLKGNGFTNYYVGYQAKKYSVTVGHFYEQFGSGLVLRSWEDRQLGINNAILGGRITVNPSENVAFKFIYGKKRNSFSTGEGQIWGADAEFNLSKLFKTAQGKNINAGLSYVGKKEDYTGPITNFPSIVHQGSLRIGYLKTNFSINAEYAIRSKDGTINDQGNLISNNRFFKGDVVQIASSFTSENTGFTITLRKVNNFAQRTDRAAPLNQLLLNYVPALTKQQDFSLANIYVYNPQVRFSFLPGNILSAAGEIGGQAEWFKNFPKNTKWGGKYGMKIGVNISHYNGLAFEGTDINTTKVSNFKSGTTNFKDVSIEIKKTFSKQLKLNFSYINQFYNQKIVEGFGNENVQTNIVVAQIINKFKNKHAIKADLQHMWVKNGKGNWAAFTIEYTIAPSFTFFVADLYHYQNTPEPIHYYNTGASFTKGSFRFMSSYGRQREGLVCVGGVCRLVPASTGFTFTTSYNF